MSTLDGVEEVTHVGTYGLDENIPKVQVQGDLPYNERKPVNMGDGVGYDGDPVIVVLVVRFRGPRVPERYDLQCINAWILDDNANTIDRIVHSK